MKFIGYIKYVHTDEIIIYIIRYTGVYIYNDTLITILLFRITIIRDLFNQYNTRISVHKDEIIIYIIRYTGVYIYNDNFIIPYNHNQNMSSKTYFET